MLGCDVLWLLVAQEEARKRVEMEGDMVIREREWEERLNKAQREKQDLQVQYRKVERQAKAFQREVREAKSVCPQAKHVLAYDREGLSCQ